MNDTTKDVIKCAYCDAPAAVMRRQVGVEAQCIGGVVFEPGPYRRYIPLGEPMAFCVQHDPGEAWTWAHVPNE